ncbi:hypothetical protein D3C81_1490700 [compost metagenome]
MVSIRIRWVPIQFCPAAQYAPETQDSTVVSRSQSPITMTGALPPRSMAIFFRPAVLVICSPVTNPPVNEIMRTARCATRAFPSSASPVATETTSAGRPALFKQLTSFTAERGANSEGFSTTELPPAMAGPSLWATRFSGSLYGVMARITPRGSRVNQPCRDSDPT